MSIFYEDLGRDMENPEFAREFAATIRGNALLELREAVKDVIKRTPHVDEGDYIVVKRDFIPDILNAIESRMPHGA